MDAEQDTQDATAGPDGTQRRAPGGSGLALAARALVAFELAQWPDGRAEELTLAIERLALQGRTLGAGIEPLIVEVKHLVNRHVSPRTDARTCREQRERLVTVLIEAYYRGGDGAGPAARRDPVPG